MKAGNFENSESDTGQSKTSDLALWAVALSFSMVGLYVLARTCFASLDLSELNELNPYLIQLYEYYKGEPQVLSLSYSYSYCVVLIAIAALVLLRKFLKKIIEAGSKQLTILLKVIVSVCILGFSFYAWEWNTNNHLNLPLIAGLSFVLIAGSSFWGKKKSTEIICEILMILLFGLATFPFVFSVTDLSVCSMEEIYHRELFYNYLFGGADQLLAGQRMLSQVSPVDGFLLPMVFCAWQKFFAILSLGDYLKIDRLFNGLYLVLVGVLFYLYAQKRSYLALFPFLLVLPWFHFYTFLIGHPHDSGWRVLSMALGLTVLYCLKSTSLKNSTTVLGVTGGFLFLLNPAIGLSMTFGYLVFIVFRHGLFSDPKLIDWLKMILRYTICFATVVAVVLGIASTFAGTIPGPEEINYYLEKLKAYFKIRGGHAPFDPMIIFVFLHCTFLLIYTGLKTNGKLPFQSSFRVCVAAVLVIWLLYYVSNPGSLNIFSYYFLYGFLVIDLLRMVLLGVNKFKKKGLIAIASALSLSLFVIPQWYFFLPRAWASYEKGSSIIERGPEPPLKMVCGVAIKSDCANLLMKKAELIKTVSKEKEIAYVTASTFMIPKMSGVYLDLPSRDIWAMPTKQLLNRYVEALKSGFNEIYIDSGNSILSGPEPFKTFHRYLEEEIEPQFEFVEEKYDWRIYRKRMK